MITDLTKSWARYRQRPFTRLVRLFLARIFHGGGEAEAEGLDVSLGLALTLLALPGGFVSILLFNKYGSLLQWMQGAVKVDPIAIALPDEYFFIVLSIVVTGAVAVWRWESIFPDRRDYFNLVALPISTLTVFFANMVALLCLVGLLALDVNAASCILFPMVVGATQTRFGFFAEFAGVHALVVVLASVFTFFAVLFVLGLWMTILPQSVFKRISPYLRAFVQVCLAVLLFTSFAVPSILQRSRSSRDWIRFLPSIWFLCLCQSLRDRADPTMAALSHIALPGLGSVLVLAICVYAVGYRRYFVRIAEMTDAVPVKGRSRLGQLGKLVDRSILRTPFQRGCAHFVWKTLFRSEPHRLLLAGIGGLGVVLASQALLAAFESASPYGTISADALSIPFILAFCIIVGLRIVFEIPIELRSNWIFQLMVDAGKHECEPMARKVILLCVLPWVFLIVIPVYSYVGSRALGNWTIGILHGLMVATWSVLLTSALLLRFRKLPFTCSLPLFRQHSIVTVLGCLMGFFLFAGVTPQFESWALSDPVRMAVIVPVAALVWYVLYRIRSNTLEIDKTLVFEEAPTRAVQVLQLGD